MTEPIIEGLSMSQSTVTRAAEQPSSGNGAPPWLDDATNARYTHHDRLLLHAMVGLEPELTTVLDARFIGCTTERLREIRQGHARALSATAAALVEDAGFAADLARLARVTGPRIIVLGDSITADSLGWADLLGACLEAAPATVAGERVRVLNMAVSGFTTSETIPLFSLVVRESPTCVLAMLGTNDGRRQGAIADIRTMTPSETERNFHALRTLTQVDSGARFLAIAPPPMNQALWDASAPSGAPARFSSEDLEATQAAIRASVPDLIDVSAAASDDGLGEAFWLPDGVHPSEKGQAVLLRHVVRAVAGLVADA